MKHKLLKTFVFLGLLLLIAASIATKKIIEYAAEPEGEKDCPPIPGGSNDINPKTEIKAADVNLPWIQKNGTINDTSCLNKTEVFGIVKVQNIEDIKTAISFAKDNGIKITAAGVKHSMGGQAFSRGGLILDMTKFNSVAINEDKKTMTAQSGATWHDIQNILHPRYAVKAMQSTDIFTVGGSISVNAHGMDHTAGSVGGTIKSMRIITPDGEIRKLSRTENPELFNLVIGGYGLFGIILDAEIEITDNVIYESKRQLINYKEFPQIFEEKLSKDENIGLFYGHLSTSPGSLLKEMIIYTYEKAGEASENTPPLVEVTNEKLRRLVINLSKTGPFMKRVKWFVEKYIEPKIETCTLSRNQAMKEGEACLVSRNEPMHDSVKYLKNNLKNETDILHEYFIPRSAFVSYIDEMRTIFEETNANLLNASVRVVHKENNFLNYAPEDAFAIVLYLNQKTTPEGNRKMEELTKRLIDLTVKHNGRFFLPYQLHYDKETLIKSYPEITQFFSLKKKYDPKTLITNKFYEKYR